MYFLLFKELFLISAFTFGGGYVIVPLVKKKFVDELELIDEDEMINLIAVSQSAPGAIAINVAILLGYKFRGISGALVCAFATALPPFIIMSIISKFYVAFKQNDYINMAMLGMRSGVSAVIINAVFKMAQPNFKSKINIALMLISFICIAIFSVSSIYVLMITFVLAGIYSLKRKEML